MILSIHTKDTSNGDKIMLISWLEDIDADAVLLELTEEQVARAKILFLNGQRDLDDMSELNAYLKTMPVVKNGWICTDLYDDAHVFNPTDDDL